MSYTNETAFLKLPQYIGTDVPSILVDFNGAMSKIDTNAQGAEEKITKATEDSAQAKSLASAAQSQSQANSNSIGTLTTRVSSVEGSVGEYDSDIAELQTNVTSAQNTANAANTAARNAQTTASAAQTSSNNNAANIAQLGNRVTALEQGGGGGDVKTTGMSGYWTSSGKNYLGNASVIWGEGTGIAGTGDAMVVGTVYFDGSQIESAGNIESVTVGGTTLYPLVEVSGNPFNIPDMYLSAMNRQFYVPASQGVIPSAVSTNFIPMTLARLANKTVIAVVNDIAPYYNLYLNQPGMIIANGRSV